MFNYFLPIWILGCACGMVYPTLNNKRKKDMFIYISVFSLMKIHSIVATWLYIESYIEHQKCTTGFFSWLTICVVLSLYIGFAIIITVMGIANVRKIAPIFKRILKINVSYSDDKCLKKHIYSIITTTVILWFLRFITQINVASKLKRPFWTIFVRDIHIRLTETFLVTVGAVFWVIWRRCCIINKRFKLAQTPHIQDESFAEVKIAQLGKIYLKLFLDAEEFANTISLSLLSAIASISVEIFTSLYFSIFSDIAEAVVVFSMLNVIISSAVIMFASFGCHVAIMESKRTGKVIHEACNNVNNPGLMKKVIYVHYVCIPTDSNKKIYLINNNLM